MKTSTAVLAVVIVAASAPQFLAFSGSSFTGTQMGAGVSNKGSLSMEYIPSGMSKAQWEKVKAAEKAKTVGKNLGKVGITTFKSRSFLDWQKSGGKNLFPVDPKKVKDPSEIPYMQRPGGTADGSDLTKNGSSPFSLFGKKKAKEPEPEPEPKKTNWWTL